MAKRGRPVSRYFMEQWTTNREMVIDDFCGLEDDEFRDKYKIWNRTYKKYFKKIFHFDNKNQKYRESIKERLKLFPGTPREAIEHIQNYGMQSFDANFALFQHEKNN